MDKISGVYKITNKITGDFYIGSSNNIKSRWIHHRSPSVWKNCTGMKLYKDMAQYGLDNFLFEIVEETAELREREQYFIDLLKPSYNDKRAKGWNTEKRIETSKRCCKAWYEIHRDERLAKNKARYRANKDDRLAKARTVRSRICLYEGETLTLGALRSRFTRQGIPHAWSEAKKYLISNHCKPNTPSQ